MIDCFISQCPPEAAEKTISSLKAQAVVKRTTKLDSPLGQTGTLKKIAAESASPYTLIYTKPTALKLVQYSLERMVSIAQDTGAAMVYSDRFLQMDGKTVNAPVIDCQPGALRDNFEFGGLMLFRTDALKEAVAMMATDYQYASLYDLRLKTSRLGELVHINEYLYYEVETDLRQSGEKQFDYVDPKNRAVQIEMEAACTDHLKVLGAWLEPGGKRIELAKDTTGIEASVVIPCRNRVQTIADAIRSALRQKTDFNYNVIVVDDNSNDGTVEVIKSLMSDPRLIHIAQDTTWHGIGGNWNSAIHHPQCGRFAVQLDSDDTYFDENSLQKIIDTFYKEQCAMVIGTYRMTDFEMNTLPPGVIDHREWTDENGRNNALRINGLGAPRAFYTPILKEINFPSTKYGEDYAVALRICRQYRIGRLYDVVYNCRRWGGNSDAALDIESVNRNDTYKDRIRSWELQARIRANKAK